MKKALIVFGTVTFLNNGMKAIIEEIKEAKLFEESNMHDLDLDEQAEAHMDSLKCNSYIIPSQYNGDIKWNA